MADSALEYTKLLAYCDKLGAATPEAFRRISMEWAGDLRSAYESLLGNIPTIFSGKRVLDFGCKYGHLAPMALARGASAYIGVDAEREYIDTASRIIGKLYDQTEFYQTEAGFIPVQPATVDVVIMNEVISHVNPAYLDTVWSETARVLRPNGILFISDGNNSANPEAARKLHELYEKWENGPEGAVTDRDVVSAPFLQRRRDIIRRHAADLPPDEVEHLAINTSGLFGATLNAVIDRYVRTRELILRPYRVGACPTNPGPFGVVMERGFHPVQLELWLREYGFEARQIEPTVSFARSGVLGPAKSIYAFLRYHFRRLADREWYRSAFEGFQIIAVKRR